MKKIFVEPQIKRIGLNINENIANSGMENFRVWVDDKTNFVFSTTYTYEQYKNGEVSRDYLEAVGCGSYYKMRMSMPGFTYVS